MRIFFAILSVLAFLCGFLYPGAWIASALFALFAAGASPGGLREDGRKRSGGLLGGLVDRAEIASRTKRCPHCAGRVDRKALYCPACGRMARPKTSADCA